MMKCLIVPLMTSIVVLTSSCAVVRHETTPPIEEVDRMYADGEYAQALKHYKSIFEMNRHANNMAENKAAWRAGIILYEGKGMNERQFDEAEAYIQEGDRWLSRQDLWDSKEGKIFEGYKFGRRKSYQMVLKAHPRYGKDDNNRRIKETLYWTERTLAIQYTDRYNQAWVSKLAEVLRAIQRNEAKASHYWCMAAATERAFADESIYANHLHSIRHYWHWQAARRGRTTSFDPLGELNNRINPRYEGGETKEDIEQDILQAKRQGKFKGKQKLDADCDSK